MGNLPVDSGMSVRGESSLSQAILQPEVGVVVDTL